jgi:hypothetical protein
VPHHLDCHHGDLGTGRSSIGKRSIVKIKSTQMRQALQRIVPRQNAHGMSTSEAHTSERLGGKIPIRGRFTPPASRGLWFRE